MLNTATGPQSSPLRVRKPFLLSSSATLVKEISWMINSIIDSRNCISGGFSSRCSQSPETRVPNGASAIVTTSGVVSVSVSRSHSTPTRRQPPCCRCFKYSGSRFPYMDSLIRSSFAITPPMPTPICERKITWEIRSKFRASAVGVYLHVEKGLNTKTEPGEGLRLPGCGMQCC
jgi:hypothetical protein